MFRTDLFEFKTRQVELHRQAEHYRLVKSLEKRNPLYHQIINKIGRVLIRSGQEMISRTQSSHWTRLNYQKE